MAHRAVAGPVGDDGGRARCGRRWPTGRPWPAALVIVALTPVLLAGLAGCGGAKPSDGTSGGDAPSGDGDAILGAAFADRAHDLLVWGSGTVAKLLADDTDGDRHQRFILRMASGQTLLVAHNIDVAPRVEGLGVGDSVAFNGVYEWSAEGGTIHWTHRDPGGAHAPGWLRHNGKTYQ